MPARHAVLRSALDEEWTILWQTGRLGVHETTDDVGDVVRRIEAFFRRRRSPLIDRQEFHARDQQEHETVDQYLVALIRIDSASAYSGEDELLCMSCMNPCGLGGHFRENRL